ncbi:unnamed protein product [Arabidopsis halleri]
MRHFIAHRRVSNSACRRDNPRRELFSPKRIGVSPSITIHPCPLRGLVTVQEPSI